MPLLGLAAVTALRRPMRADANGIEAEPLRSKGVDDEALCQFELLAWKGSRAETVLVGDHDQSISSRGEFLQRREYIRHETDFFQAVDLLIGRFLDQRAITIDEQHLARHLVLSPAHCRLSSTRSFC